MIQSTLVQKLLDVKFTFSVIVTSKWLVFWHYQILLIASLEAGNQIGSGCTNFTLWLSHQTTQFIASYVRTFFNKISCICTKDCNESIWRQIKHPAIEVGCASKNWMIVITNSSSFPMYSPVSMEEASFFESWPNAPSFFLVVIFELKWDNPKWLENYRQLVKLVDRKIRRVETWRSVEQKEAWYSPQNSCQISHQNLAYIFSYNFLYMRPIFAIYDAWKWAHWWNIVLSNFEVILVVLKTDFSEDTLTLKSFWFSFPWNGLILYETID